MDDLTGLTDYLRGQVQYFADRLARVRRQLELPNLVIRERHCLDRDARQTEDHVRRWQAWLDAVQQLRASRQAA